MRPVRRTRWPTLVTAYYGRPLRNKIARARLFGLVAKYGWTLWGAIQDATSPLDFDFWSWAMERYEGAAAGPRPARTSTGCSTTCSARTDQGDGARYARTAPGS